MIESSHNKKYLPGGDAPVGRLLALGLIVALLLPCVSALSSEGLPGVSSQTATSFLSQVLPSGASPRVTPSGWYRDVAPWIIQSFQQTVAGSWCSLSGDPTDDTLRKDPPPANQVRQSTSLSGKFLVASPLHLTRPSGSSSPFAPVHTPGTDRRAEDIFHPPQGLG